MLGHGRYLVEKIGPELRQYIVAGNDEERPFSRDQRRWVYASAKLENNYFGFGTDNDVEHTPGYVIVKHRTFGRAVPSSSPRVGQEAWLPCAKVLGAARGRLQAFHPDSVVNISGMSFGSLSGNAVAALNKGAALAGCFAGAAKLGLPDNAVVAFALGVDLVYVAREAMLAIGCIQAQKCHTDTCPTGVATQNRWLAHGLDPELKSVRAANYIRTLRRDLIKVAEATGVEHPSMIGTDDVEILTGQTVGTPLHEIYGYERDWGYPSQADRDEVLALMAGTSPEGGSAPPSPTAAGRA